MKVHAKRSGRCGQLGGVPRGRQQRGENRGEGEGIAVGTRWAGMLPPGAPQEGDIAQGGRGGRSAMIAVTAADAS